MLAGKTLHHSIGGYHLPLVFRCAIDFYNIRPAVCVRLFMAVLSILMTVFFTDRQTEHTTHFSIYHCHLRRRVLHCYYYCHHCKLDWFTIHDLSLSLFKIFYGSAIYLAWRILKLHQGIDECCYFKSFTSVYQMLKGK